ncbi:uroporphyrinogen-III synthase [Parashewanella curva]|uniref:Uroporphyrinogen-III synthase n=1 Tax=Parashewanella curva TaxID=2338552 RepID=A0A3L8Q0H0_9GAMM|nr:uroporphyrinogen-III synthase [Parashewanella curva]RLV60288.1 uroporphyrinogen-III synthase [Parashewanella curva]
MKVLLTRPKGKNEGLANQLQAVGIASVCQPLMTVSALAPSLEADTRIQQADIVIFISVNAVNYATTALFEAISPSAQVFAIGSATQQQLHQRGIDALCPPEFEQHSEGLLSLSQFHDLTGQRVVIVRGKGGREFLAEQAQKRGAEVYYTEIYQRLKPKLDADICVAEWELQNIDTVIVTSGEIFTNLLTLMTNADGEWLKQCQLIVVSERIEAMARSNGFAKVVNAGGASDIALLETCILLHQGSS